MIFSGRNIEVKEGIAVMSISETFQLILVICAVASLFYQIGKRK